MAAAALGCSVLVAAWLTAGGPAGWLYLAGFSVATVPGLPIGWLLFGRRHAGGWIAGALIGYALTCLVIWAAFAAGPYFALAAAGGWLLLSVAGLWLCSGSEGPLVDLGSWTRRDTTALVCLLVLTIIVATIPLRRVGALDDAGNRQYRAYFTADFLWHTALTAELTSGAMPPRNPYLASQPIHYYWTYFLVPAAIARSGPGFVGDVETCLKLNAFATGLLFLSAVFLAAHAAVRRSAAAALASGLALVASSAEGLYELFRIWSLDAPLSALRGINVDALTAWYFQGHRIDGLQRCLWYVPQHSMAYALGLIALAAGAGSGARAPVGAILIVGLALAGSVLMNPFVGGVFALAWGIAAAVNALETPSPLRRITLHSVAVIPVAAAIAWCVSNRMVEGAGNALVLGSGGASRHFPLWNLMLSLGPALLPAILLLLVRPNAVSFRRLLPALTLTTISLVIMHTVRLSVDEPWVPFRAGQMLLAAVPALTAAFLLGTLEYAAGKALAILAVGALLVAGLPTTAIDAYNAQDISDRGSGAGFHWTLVVSPEEQAALDWIRTSTPRNAIVQMEPTLRDRDSSPGGWGEFWSLIPSLAQRRMAAGLPISLLRVPAYAERSQKVKEIYETPDAIQAWQAARALRIEYLYADARDRAAYPNCAKFDAAGDQFENVFRLREVGVYRVK